MTTDNLKDAAGRAAAFQAFRQNPYYRFMTRLRQRRAEQIRVLSAEPRAISLERFNNEIWQIGSRITLGGQPIRDRIFDAAPSAARLAELTAALEAGDLEVEGNTVWRAGSSVYGSSVKESNDAKELHLQRALAILGDEKLAPYEQVSRIEQIAGFGQGAANMLVMIAAPTRWALDNDKARSALRRMGFAASNSTEVQVSASQLREELGADDFIELDLFLYHISQRGKAPDREVRIWWVNQGLSYAHERGMSCIQASPQGADGRHVPARAAVAEVRPGDIILHHHQRYLRAVSKVRGEPELVSLSNGDQLRRVATDYTELSAPIRSAELAQALYAMEIPSGPIGKDLAPKQGYLHSFTLDGLRLVVEAGADNHWPSYVTDMLAGAAISSGVPNGVTPPAPTLPPFKAVLESLRRRGLSFPPEVVSSYLIALQAKGFVILTGISGTGKTQLALAVADHFRPQISEQIVSVMPEGALALTVKPYMRKYRQMVLPVALTGDLVLPPIDPATNGGMITVHYPSGSVQQALYKDPERNVMSLTFSGPLRAWFDTALPEGATFLVEVVPGDDGGSSALRFSAPATTRRTRRLDNYLVVAVRPDWTDSRGLLGYYNPLTRRYESTPFLRFLLEAATEEQRAAEEGREPYPYFLVLDEMNLARVEYYFADFLSCIESDEPLELHDSAQIEAGAGAEAEQQPIPRRLRVPRNLLFTGTVNVDETTSMFSPKVLDRAFTLEFNQVDLAGFGVATAPGATVAGFILDGLGELVQPDQVTSSEWVIFGGLEGGTLRQAVVDLNTVLATEQRHFGYRVANEIARFVNLAAEQAGADTATLWTALDLAILAKALPKLQGTQQELELLLAALFAFAIQAVPAAKPPDADTILAQWADEGGQLASVPGVTPGVAPKLPRTAAKLWRMLRRLRQQGFTAFVS